MTKPVTRSLAPNRDLPHPPEEAWRALTQRPFIFEQCLMKNDFQPVVGYGFIFRAEPVPRWNGGLRGVGRRTLSAALLQLERFGRGGGDRYQDGRHLDLDTGTAWHAPGHGMGLSAGNGGRVSAREQLRLAALLDKRDRVVGGRS